MNILYRYIARQIFKELDGKMRTRGFTKVINVKMYSQIKKKYV